MTSGFVVRAGAGRPMPAAGGEVLARVNQTDGEFSLLLSHAPAGDLAPLHTRDRESESFFILAGRYAIRCGHDQWEATTGDFVYLPRRVPHAWRVVGPDAGRKLVLALPGGIEDFFVDLAAGVAVDELTHRHGVHFLD